MDKVLFSPLTAAFALFCLTASFFLPVDGLGVNLCWFQWATTLPCPGCGLTRSVTCISHMQLSKAIAYHPFGPLVYALFVANVVLLVLPTGKRIAVKQKAAEGGPWLRLIYTAIVAAFLLFGIGRIVYKLYYIG